MTACIVGIAHTPFGKLDAESVESLVVKVAGEALTDAGIEAKDVEAWAQRYLQELMEKVTDADVIMVALDKEGHPTPVPREN